MYGYYVLLTSWNNLGERLVEDVEMKFRKTILLHVFIFFFSEEALCPSTFIDTPPTPPL